ncbi:hypothetical protein CCMA1212_008883 [Trichoderma ghanense]|uniref:Secreted protein n=1 Tax=Trichoderma ghanense TaxID=65468 RepID=A0ABY2GU97_9HYPO
MMPTWAAFSIPTLLCLTLLHPSVSDIGFGHFNNPDILFLRPWFHLSDLAPGFSAGTVSGPLPLSALDRASWTNAFLRFVFYPPGYSGALCCLDVSIKS